MEKGGSHKKVPFLTKKNIYIYFKFKYFKLKRFSCVNPKKEDIYQEGLLMANWIQIYKQSLAVIPKQGPLKQALL